MALDQLAVSGAAPSGVQDDQIERGRIGGAVIGRVRDQLEMGELAGAQLVHDLAGLGVAPIVPFGGLIAGQHIERATREIRVDVQRFAGRRSASRGRTARQTRECRQPE